LLRLILGQLRAWSGQVQLAGKQTTKWTPAQRARLASYVPQRGLVSFAFTVEQVVAMGRFASPLDGNALEAALEATDLTEHRHRIYQELSTGQQQRVLLARALAQSSGAGEVMLLDEPGSAMDLWHVHRMMQTLQQLARQGLCVLVAIHDLNLAARYADEVWLLDDKRMAACGPWDQVMRPEVLEPVYRVGICPLMAEGAKRPVFHVEPSDMMD
jgi:iron complex transport system ATP-binding protein